MSTKACLSQQIDSSERLFVLQCRAVIGGSLTRQQHRPLLIDNGGREDRLTGSVPITCLRGQHACFPFPQVRLETSRKDARLRVPATVLFSSQRGASTCCDLRVPRRHTVDVALRPRSEVFVKLVLENVQNANFFMPC